VPAAPPQKGSARAPANTRARTATHLSHERRTPQATHARAHHTHTASHHAPPCVLARLPPPSRRAHRVRRQPYTATRVLPSRRAHHVRCQPYTANAHVYRCMQRTSCHHCNSAPLCSRSVCRHSGTKSLCCRLPLPVRTWAANVRLCHILCQPYTATRVLCCAMPLWEERGSAAPPSMQAPHGPG
jgi:hypothetical protein